MNEIIRGQMPTSGIKNRALRNGKRVSERDAEATKQK